MKLFVWKHSKLFSSRSMLEEPNVYADMYMQAELAVAAGSLEEAYGIISENPKWNIEELKRIPPRIYEENYKGIVAEMIYGG